MNGKIAVCYHKKMPFIHNEVLTPFLLNAQKKPLPGFEYADDIGENISSKNETYCEITALYAIWKNEVWQDMDYIGLFHYRRILSLNKQLNDQLSEHDLFEINEVNGEYTQYGLSKFQIDQVMQNCDVILPMPRTFADTVYDQYANSKDHYIEHVKSALAFIKKNYPAYKESAQHVFDSHQVSLYNMFVMRTDLFRIYCEWLFPILRDAETAMDDSLFNIQERRYIGFLTERLFNVFIHYQQKYRQLDIRYFPVFQLNYEQPSTKLQEVLRIRDKVALFGTGTYAAKMTVMLNNPIVCFVDNNEKLESFADLEVLTPVEYQRRFGKRNPILICSSYEEQISQQLSSMGYEHNQDYFKLDTSYFIAQRLEAH
ncbi:DUF4422 domain-containing protein [Saccharibacillus sacchari]|uniref:DUF4422 domain-containing protein n=1 Tax=Saccharibacillus sacchari TaxID=456493 RepID=UPI0004BBEF2D|nr:DUF4422 domain-containing protein [Saccharibacillus sacchari]